MSRSHLVVSLACVMAACAAPSVDDAPLVAPLVDPGSAEEAGILAFLHDASTDFVVLDEDVGLDRRAARGLIDGRPFASIGEVDAVAYVGAVALQRLLDWAQTHGWVHAATEDRDAAMLALVNDPSTTFVLLDVDVALDRRAAMGIMAGRPFTSVAQLDAVPYVGATALDLLATYALAHGYTGAPPTSEAPCAIFSEVTEGQGASNKAVEIFNCGAAPLVLADVGLCLVRNADASCSVSTTLEGAATELAPGAVLIACRTRAGTFNDPMTSLRDACDLEVGSVANFNGDDRLVLFVDQDGDGQWGSAEPALDMFGDPASAPSDTVWAEATFRRCDLRPRSGGAFDVDALFTRHARHDHTHLGTPPTETCGPPVIASEGEPCREHAGCEAGLRCFGIPRDGSGEHGRCIDTTSVPGDGATCDRFRPCLEGLVCAGWTIWAEGSCVPQWMAGRYAADIASPIAVADAPSGGIASSVVVSGLASVPVDLDVTVHIEHPRLTDLRVTLFDPNGDSAVLWDRSTELSTWSRSFVTTGISRDDAVNGRWQLRVEDLVTGETGALHGWTLFVVSRWD